MLSAYHRFSQMIDHSLLNPALTTSDLEAGCRLAVVYEVASVCIMPHYLKRCAEILCDTEVRSSTTVGFPHGAHTTAVKLAEANRALQDGCEEVDMVINISRALSGDWDYVRDEIKAITELVHGCGQKLKVIFENCYLENRDKIRLCEICGELSVDWVKTSTGYGSGGATIEDLQLMRQHSPPHVQVKAAGGIRDFAALQKMQELGVTRVGASRTQEILDECRKHLGLPDIHIESRSAAGY